MSKDDLWNSLASTFDTHKTDASRIDPGAADNILIAWPVLLRLLAQSFHSLREKRALDFGCGTGGFCQRLADMEMKVTGVDSSPAMLNLARKHTAPSIRYSLGSTGTLEQLGTFDAIFSVMALQFIERPFATLEAFHRSLPSGGLLAFAVHNPEYVTRWHSRGEKFADLDKNERSALLIFSPDQKARLFLRSAADYDTWLFRLGFEKVTEEYPPFTEEFLEKFGEDEDVSVSDKEYLVLGYRKL